MTQFKRRIRVIVIDDSAVVRQVLKQVLSRQPDIEVIATASDPLFAIKKMEQEWPDVVLLDIEMPRMDGLTFLRKLMTERPTPVVICSSLAGQGTEVGMQAMQAGAVAILTKPTSAVGDFLEENSAEIVAAVRAGAAANLRNVRAVQPASGANKGVSATLRSTECIVAIGTSTGGTVALEEVLTALPSDSPGLVIVQHMPAGFTAAFASRLNQVARINVEEARDGQRVLPGSALIAPGGRHLTVLRNGAQYMVKVHDGPPVNCHRPSVDVLFRSVARVAGRNAIGIIMTGMGADGARGLKEMHEAGAYTLAQDEASCVVYGMPKEAVALGAVSRVLPLQGIAAAIIRGPSEAGAR
ncbi:protein-glutamate methylesterase/protein-glutamine glutaminase [Chitinimonas lacunae]|uniref:Protein-glutamate methylesterase/protein-glutamine glutaminase n=1 Tax=Chitinimonas lacunae TaxID=1963018 RepID=A0ABV8MKS9_9NEIS